MRCLISILLFTSFVFAADSPRQIELILDCSGSMNAKLAAGGTRIEAARQAVSTLLNQLPDSTVLAFRAYGHQSPKEKHDCQDTQLLQPFQPLSQNKKEILARLPGLRALGYTPITKVIQLAAEDFKSNAGAERTIILVSDGKETCEGDPCATARALRASGVHLVIHTVGFSVDDSARFQLQCIAASTGGAYFDAANADQLAKALQSAAVANARPVPAEKKGGGKLKIEHADLSGHKVIDAVTGKEVAKITSLQSVVTIPAGIYNVQFGQGMWKSVEVKEGATTVLQPGVLQIHNAALTGHMVMDSETGLEQGKITSLSSQITILPGLYDVTFGDAVWQNVQVNGGKVTELNPGVLHVPDASLEGHEIRDAAGHTVGKVSSLGTSMTLPPGDYTVALKGKNVAFSITEGKEVTLSNK